MSDGLKVGLIFGGVAVVGYVILKNSQAVAATPLGTTTTPAPTGGISGILQTILGHAPGSGTAPTLPQPSTQPAATPAQPSTNPVSRLASTFYNVDKTIIKGVAGVASSTVHSVASVASSAVHSVFSIF